ncbi:hypothetical protein KVT40_005834 [Elsinoe batatas]|uniref:Uncharacterized protein n=1 Tax=Elsinoe batatas TaxID=2601811 RepID=A0A8K0L1U8_9PEZI|nr:hypothetical protein KVT40_005834 [Elsinoe batatas]
MGFFSNLSAIASIISKLPATPTTTPASVPARPTDTPYPAPIYTPHLAVHTLGCNVQYDATKPASIQYVNTTSTTTVLSGTNSVIPTVTGTVFSTITNHVTVTTTKASGTATTTSAVTITPSVSTLQKTFGTCGPKPSVIKRAGAVFEKRDIASVTATEVAPAFVVAATCSYQAILYLPSATVTSIFTATPLITSTTTITKEAITPASTLTIRFTNVAPLHTVTHCAQCRGLQKQGCPTYDIVW